MRACVRVCSADGKYEVTYKPNVVVFYTGDVLDTWPQRTMTSSVLGMFEAMTSSFRSLTSPATYCGSRRPSTRVHVQWTSSFSRSTSNIARWSSVRGRSANAKSVSIGTRTTDRSRIYLLTLEFLALSICVDSIIVYNFLCRKNYFENVYHTTYKY